MEAFTVFQLMKGLLDVIVALYNMTNFYNKPFTVRTKKTI